ncbi:helix-turn-helix domain-containing protein [Photobacterium carnosum]|uniref:helix-turn-helix domain-containing protein n=1 Tax=Photobacterium carnosum TaxID=2023717 RepID=UPI00128AED32|nr:helix-turn-helix domain-containing protein [Photobacterium carnosum]KAE8175596.1 DNA-binding protein [Photobacterium carnosum]MCD9522955.1 helix-turn-helix domain-containing protein [Photobacterium carnosum]
MNIRPIRTNIDYKIAMARISELTKGDPDSLPDSQFDELEILTTLTDAYENIHHKIDTPDPVEAIKFRMEQQGLQDEDLTSILGQRSRVSEILNKKRRLSLSMIRKLNKQLNIPFDSLLNEYALIK